MGRRIAMYRPTGMRGDYRPVVLPAPDGLIHRVVFLDAVYWRPPCAISPLTKPKGWKQFSQDTPITCLLCLSEIDEVWQ